MGASVVIATGNHGLQGGRGRRVGGSEDHSARNVRWDPLNVDSFLEKLDNRQKRFTEDMDPAKAEKYVF